MIINIQNFRPVSNRRKQNIAYGIQKWLLSKGYIHGKSEFQVDREKYWALLKEFCEKQEGFDPKLIKELETYESYVDKRFSKFCSFVTIKFATEYEKV